MAASVGERVREALEVRPGRGVPCVGDGFVSGCCDSHEQLDGVPSTTFL
jgi:hypothetical protein